jgi:hypothetical protein
MFRAGCVLIAGILTSCSPKVERTPVGPGADTTGGPPRATVVVVPRFAARDSAIVRLLGGAREAAAGATVTLRREGTAAAITATLDDTGAFVATGMLEGSYTVAVQRVLTAFEREKLASSVPDADAFVASASFFVDAPRTDQRPEVSFGRRGSLILSEVNHSTPYDPSTGAEYLNGQYVELYNNGDTTVYLDGVTIALGLATTYDFPNFPCSLYEPMTLDTAGIWADFMWRLPGEGTTYPLRPGQIAVFASDAIDHTVFVSSAANLAGAQFEVPSSSGVDNPSVPNASQIGTRTYSYDGGFRMFHTIPVVVIARRLDVARLEQRLQAGTEDLMRARIPADSIYDVVVSRSVLNRGYNLCPRPIAERFERQMASVIQAVDSMTLQRRVLYTRDGRKVLQRTGATAADFERSVGTPGTLP